MTTEPIYKPYRPFGVTIAILLAVVFYSLIPLFFTGQLLLVESHFNSRPDVWVFPQESVEEIARGGNLTGDITRLDMMVQVVLALVFMVIAFFAWRGKPHWMRYVFAVSVIGISAMTIVIFVFPAPTADMSGGSLDGLARLLRPGVFAWYVLLPLYVVWYLNRAPARAFYRGYYLPEELEAIAQMTDA